MDQDRYDIVMVLVDYFGKRTISIPCYKSINTKEVAWLYIQYPYYIYNLLDTIILDYRLQFILAF